MAKKNKTTLVKLVSTGKIEATGKPSAHFYTTNKNPRMEGGHNGKLRLRKYDPKTRKHEWYEEKKIK